MSTTKGSIGPLALLFWVVLATSVMLAVVLASPPARAASYTVTNTNDSEAGSLRQAIIDANASAGVADTIGFAPYLSGRTITLASRLPGISAAGGALAIDGGSGANITISGNDQHAVLYVGDGAKLTLNKLTVANGHFSGAGGGICNCGGELTVMNSTISGNSSDFGGGIYNYGTGSNLRVMNSTISGNSSTNGGGGIDNFDGAVEVNNSTIAENRASAGGGIQNDTGTADLWNTIVANNHSPAGDSNCSGTITDHGHNLDSGDSCDFSWYWDNLNSYSNTDPFLGDLADNGGPTKTMALLAGSVAITKDDGGYINVSFNPNAVDPYGKPLQFDQRGQRYARIAAGAVDIGAYEYQGGLGSEPPPAEVPENKRACKKGGFREFGFKNQGQCIKAVNHAS